jgi:hypothetical protein
MCFDIVSILHRLPLPGSELTLVIVDAIRMAKDPEISIIDCPWGASRDRLIRARRICWRVAFRMERERMQIALAALPLWRAA